LNRQNDDNNEDDTDRTCGAYETDMHAEFLWGGKREEKRFKI